MKKFILLILVLFIISPNIVKAEDMTIGEYGTYDNAIKIVQESMKAYYLRGPYLQYNYAKATYGEESPEEATSQDHKYIVCAAFTYNVYTEAFGMYYVNNLSTFPRYNYNIVEEAYKKYNSGDPLDGTFLIYYQSTVDTADGSRQREKVKYIYGDNNSDTTDDYQTLVDNVKPGDLFVYTGHALIAYDVVINPKTNKKDVLILNSTADEYIRTRIDGTSRLSYNLFQSQYGYNSFLDVPMEGSIEWLWLSENSYFVDNNGNLQCKDAECAIIRPVYEKDGKAVFNYYMTPSKYEQGNLRTQYPGLMIEKTVNVSDNDSIYIGDELTYTIKISNKSGVNYNKVNYGSFSIEENIGNNVSYLASTQNGVYQNGKITWNINNLNADSVITLTYTVKVNNDVSLVGKTITATGKFYNSNNKNIYISTGTVNNKIIPKVTTLNNTYKECYNKNNANYAGLNLINEVYKCVTNTNYNFDQFSFEKLFTKTTGTNPKTNSTINISSNLDENHSTFKNMILNDYFNGLIEKDGKYYIPRFTTANKRNKTIMSSDFKDGDVLIYEINSSKFTQENGIYAYIYIDGKFIGINGSESTQRNAFVYNYYENTNTVSSSICSKYSYSYGTICNYAYNLYGGYPKLTDDTTKDKILEFVNYQTLMDKDNYIILRPEQVIKELLQTEIMPPSKLNYIQNYETLDLTGATLTLTYNNGIVGPINLTNELVKVTGFDNSKIGKNTVTIQYNNDTQATATFDIEIISKQATKIEVLTLPTKTNYIQNYETLDLTGGILKITYNDNTTDEISMTNELVKATGFDNSKIGKNQITINYNGLTTNFNIKIISKQATKIEVLTLPTKTNYIQNYETLDLTGGILKITYNDNTTDEISMTNELVTASGFDNSKIGKNEIEAIYEGNSTRFEVSIVSKEITKIKIAVTPLKKNYIQNYETLDLTGGILKITYNDNTTDEISMTNELVKATGFDNSEIGKKTIIIQYNDYTDEFEVEIISKQLVMIEIIKLPTNIKYLENIDALDLTGGILKITYNDNTTDEISMTNELVTASGFDNSKIGKNTVTLKYKGHSTTFEAEITKGDIIENPQTGLKKFIILILIIVSIVISNLYYNKTINNKS